MEDTRTRKKEYVGYEYKEVITDKAKEFRRQYDQPSEQAMQSIFGNISEEELLTTISVFTRLNKNVDQLKGQVK